MTILQTKDLRKYYGSGDTLVKALDGVDLNVEDGEFVAIVAPQEAGNPPCSICWAVWTGPPPVLSP